MNLNNIFRTSPLLRILVFLLISYLTEYYLKRRYHAKKSTNHRKRFTQSHAEYLIDLGEDDSKEAYFAETWMKAVDEGLVDSANETDYEMKFVEDLPAE